MCIVQIAHGVTQPPDRLAIEYSTCVIIPDPLHQVLYSCHDPHRCPPCCTCHLHTTSQANVILHMKRRIKVKLLKCSKFEFKPRHVNDLSPIKLRYLLLDFSEDDPPGELTVPQTDIRINPMSNLIVIHIGLIVTSKKAYVMLSSRTEQQSLFSRKSVGFGCELAWPRYESHLCWHCPCLEYRSRIVEKIAKETIRMNH
jgi:hypothetical protein